MKKEKLELLLKNKNKNKNNNYDLKLTRRELLEVGMISSAARIAIPGAISSLLSKTVMAAEEGSMIPFITLSLSGGAALHGNYVVKDKMGQLLPSYSKLGLGQRGFKTEKVMGADFASSSQFHKGVKSVATSNTLSKSSLLALCTNTANDTNGLSSTRPFYDLSGPLERAGLVGKLLPVIHQGFTAENLRPVFSAPNTTLEVSSLENMFGALKYTSALSNPNLLDVNKRNLLSSFIGKMTKTQMGKLQSKKDGLKEVLQEAGIQSTEIIAAGGEKSVDPRLNAYVRSVYKIEANTAVNNATALTAGIVYNALNGNISHGRITLGGYDYHSPGLRASADIKDFEAGVQLGKMLELANKMKRPLFILVTTDGACVSAESNSSTSEWTSDYSSSVQFIIAFDPNGKIISKGNQIGHYLSDQSVDATTLVGSRPDYVAAAILANYLNLNKKIGLFKQLAPATLQNDDLNKVVKLNIA